MTTDLGQHLLCWKVYSSSSSQEDIWSQMTPLVLKCVLQFQLTTWQLISATPCVLKSVTQFQLTIRQLILDNTVCVEKCTPVPVHNMTIDLGQQLVCWKVLIFNNTLCVEKCTPVRPHNTLWAGSKISCSITSLGNFLGMGNVSAVQQKQQNVVE